MNIFDWLHEEFFDLLFGLDKADRQESACFAREHGVGAEEVRQILAGDFRHGWTLGGAHAIDVRAVMERVLIRQGARSITLRVSHPPHDEAGHLEIRIIEVEPPPEPSREAGPAPQTPGQDTT